MTVGSGIKPDLLTLILLCNLHASADKALADLSSRSYRRWGIAPRPENFAASGSARQYRKETGELKVSKMNQALYGLVRSCRDPVLLQAL